MTAQKTDRRGQKRRKKIHARELTDAEYQELIDKIKENL